MIRWVNNKQINAENITKKIDECITSRHFTNNGKRVVLDVEPSTTIY